MVSARLRITALVYSVTKEAETFLEAFRQMDGNIDILFRNILCAEFNY